MSKLKGCFTQLRVSLIAAFPTKRHALGKQSSIFFSLKLFIHHYSLWFLVVFFPMNRWKLRSLWWWWFSRASRPAFLPSETDMLWGYCKWDPVMDRSELSCKKWAIHISSTVKNISSKVNNPFVYHTMLKKKINRNQTLTAGGALAYRRYSGCPFSVLVQCCNCSYLKKPSINRVRCSETSLPIRPRKWYILRFFFANGAAAAYAA